MIREKIQRNHKVDAHQIIFSRWRKNERCTRNVTDENESRQSADSIKPSVHPT
ncbi:hypothetical protein F157LOC_02690 [Pectobacterium brasiliense]|nr:hypothetical protein F157LOC_02690 [Pectobacterium brasiliense]